MSRQFLPKFTVFLFAAGLMLHPLGAQEPAKAAPTIKPNALFTDGMVLQRDKALPVWGSAKPNDEITVSFRQQTAKTTADGEGRWKVALKPEAAGGPDTLTIAGKDGAVTVQNVLVGEVWVCSGQSNMAFKLERAKKDNLPETGAPADPSLRLFTLGQNPQDKPQASPKGRWAEVTPETAKGVSAVAYFFGADLRKKLNVPVGLIVTAVGGTSASAWTSVEGFGKNPVLEDVYIKTWQETLAKLPEAKAKFEADLAAYNERKAQFEAGQAAAPTADAAASPKQGGGAALENIEAGAENAAAKPAAKAAFAEKPPRAPQGPESPKRPYGLFNGMVNPLIPYAIRGFVWYQGETDATTLRAPVYAQMLRAMILDWRTRWDEKALPFLIVQLPGFEQGDNDWVTLQQAQAAVAKDSGNGMVVTIDLGEQKDVHPTNKLPVGQRLAALALADVYGIKSHAHAPEPAAVTKSGGEVKVTFKTDGDVALTAVPTGAPQGFQIAGADGAFVDAQAKLDGKTVVLTSTVAEPKTVRYAYKAWPLVGVFDAEKLPAGPFEKTIP